MDAFSLSISTELLLKLELVQLPLCLVQLLRAWLRYETRATGCLVPKLVELPLCLSEFLVALEILKLVALVEFVDLFLLGGPNPTLVSPAANSPETRTLSR